MKATGHILKNITRIMSGGVVLLLISCSSSDNAKTATDVLARVGKQTLTLAELKKSMPGGLNEEDSVRFVKAFVNEWVETRLISDIASDEIDMTEINRLVDEYRNELIAREYARRMFEAHAANIPEDSVRTYYDAHKEDFKLDRPMVKGTYLKVPEDAKNLKVLRRLYQSDKHVDADKLEKEVIKSAIHYDYFRNRWVDWEQIETKIPYDFGVTGDQWLAKNRKLETTAGGFTYLLYITEVLPKGSPMPLEAARSQIVNRLLNFSRKEYNESLKKELLNKAKDSGKIEINI